MGVAVGGITVFSQFYCIFKGWYNMELSFQHMNMFVHQSTRESTVHIALPQTNNIAYARPLYNNIFLIMNP